MNNFQLKLFIIACLSVNISCSKDKPSISEKNGEVPIFVTSYDSNYNIKYKKIMLDSSRVKGTSITNIFDSTAKGWLIFDGHPVFAEYFFPNPSFPKCKIYSIDSVRKGIKYVRELREDSLLFVKYIYHKDPLVAQEFKDDFILITDTTVDDSEIILYSSVHFHDGKIDTSALYIFYPK